MSLSFIPAMEPILTEQIPKMRDLIFQIKWDGIRMHAMIEKERIRLFTKNGNERTGYYPELDDLHRPSLYETYLDGELIVFHPSKQKPDFKRIVTRDRVRRQDRIKEMMKKYPVIYMVFDILVYRGESLLHQSWTERNRLLRSILPASQHLLYTESFTDGERLLAEMESRGWEGIVAKNRYSSYQEGKKHHDWWKIKVFHKLDACIGGISYKNGMPNALLLGDYQGGQFRYIGKVSAGLSVQDRVMLHKNISVLELPSSPFSNVVPTKGEIRWIKPVLAVQVKYLEWTEDGILRHPNITGFLTANQD